MMLAKTKSLLGLLAFLPVSAWADHTTIGLQGNVTGPSTTSSAEPMELGRFGISLQYQQVDFKSISTAEFENAAEQDRDLHATDSISNSGFTLTYGVSDRLTLGFSIANVRRSGLIEAAHHDDEGEEPHRDGGEEDVIENLGSASGLSDARLYAAYRFWSDENTSTSVYFGVELPTGETGETSIDGHRLETEFQPGSGSWDPLLAFALTRRFDNWTFNSNVIYTFATEGSQKTNLGDVFNYNLAMTHALPKFGLLSESAWNLDFVFEVNGEWRDRVDIAGETEFNSGGNIIYLSPGLSLRNDKFSISASISKAVENLNGVQSEPDLRFVLNFGWAL